MNERIIAVVQLLAWLTLQKKSKAVRADFQHIVRSKRDALANPLPIQKYTVEALAVSEKDVALLPDQLGMIARSHFIIEPDLVRFVTPDSNNHALERQALPLEIATTVLQPTPRRVVSIHKRDRHTSLIARWYRLGIRRFSTDLPFSCPGNTRGRQRITRLCQQTICAGDSQRQKPAAKCHIRQHYFDLDHRELALPNTET